MRVRLGWLVATALVVLAPGGVFAQTPPGMPNIDELMRNAPTGSGGPAARRPHPTQGPPPPGVPVPRDSPLIAAFERFETAQSYRVSMDMIATDPRMQQMMRQAGMGHFEKVMMRPDTQLVTLYLRMPGADGPTKLEDWQVQAIVKGHRLARKFSAPSQDRILAMQRASMAQQLAQADMAATMGIAQALAMGPLGIPSAAVMMGSLVMSHAAAAATLEKTEAFFRWTCSDAPAGESRSRSPDSVTFTDMVDLGERVDADVPVHAYRFFVLEQGQYQGPVEVDVARGTGLPTRFTMADPEGRGTIVLRYSDYDRPVTAETPPCLAN